MGWIKKSKILLTYLNFKFLFFFSSYTLNVIFGIEVIKRKCEKLHYLYSQDQKYSQTVTLFISFHGSIADVLIQCAEALAAMTVSGTLHQHIRYCQSL